MKSAKANGGYILLHRKMLENPICTKDADHLAVWIYLLLQATHTERDVIFDNKRITLKAGQLITGRKKIAHFLHLNESKVQRILLLQISEQQIEQRTSNQSRLITILNWSTYQKSEQRNEQRVNNERTTSEQRVNTNNKGKNVKNEKEGKYVPQKYKFNSLRDGEVAKLLEQEKDFVGYELQETCNSMADWVESRGRELYYKNYLAFARTWIRREIASEKLLPTSTAGKKKMTQAEIDEAFNKIIEENNAKLRQ